MHADLERVVALQRLDSATQDAQRRLAEEPDRQKAIDARLAAEQKASDADRRTLASDVEALRTSLEKIRAERSELVRNIDPQVLAVYDLVSRRRNGIGVAEARAGICTICHVRLRPQVFNNIRRNDSIIQCDSCQRILYFSPAAAAQTPDSVSQPTP